MGMFHNGANCDIYVGKGAGKKLMQDIENAKRSVKVISPYLSPFLIKELIGLKNRNIDIQLITVDDIEEHKNSFEKNAHQLIRQHIYIDEEARIERNKWIKTSKIILIGMIALPICISALLLYITGISAYIGVGIISFFILFLAYMLLQNNIKKKRIYNYSYSQLFPFKVYMSPYTHPNSDTFIHAKIYLIDDTIAYLGSLNFTTSGTKQNYETRIRTTDPKAIKEIKDEFYNLFHHSQIPERCMQQWGKYLYTEPIN